MSHFHSQACTGMKLQFQVLKPVYTLFLAAVIGTRAIQVHSKMMHSGHLLWLCSAFWSAAARTQQSALVQLLFSPVCYICSSDEWVCPLHSSFCARVRACVRVSAFSKSLFPWGGVSVLVKAFCCHAHLPPLTTGGGLGGGGAHLNLK